MDALSSALMAEAERLWHVSDRVSRVLSDLDGSHWSGAAAEAFAGRLRAVTDGAKAASDRHVEAADASRRWCGELWAAQEDADAALREAEEALEHLSTAKALPADVVSAPARVAEAEQRVAEAKAKARHAQQEHAEAEARFVAALDATLHGARPRVPVGQLEDFLDTFSTAAFVLPASTTTKSTKATSEKLLKEVELQYRTCRTEAEWAAWAKKNGYAPAEVIAALKKMKPDDLKRFNQLIAHGGIAGGLASWLFEGARSRKDVAWLHDHLPSLEPQIPGGTFWNEWDDIDLSWPFGPEDINQGGVNDCWWLATLAAYADTPEGANWLKDHIHDNGNGSYTVTLYRDGKPIKVTVTDYFPAVKGKDGRTYPYGAYRGDEPNWVSIFEKARAAMPDTGSYDFVNGFYSVFNKDFGSGGAMETLTGDPAHWFSPPGPHRADTHSASELRGDLEEGRPITVTTAFPGREDMVNWHVYTVMAIDEQGNVALRNPWGPGDGTMPEYVHLTFEEMCRAGWYVNIGAPK